MANNKQKTKAEPTTNTAPAVEASAPENITMEDLRWLAKIIEVASTRGAFKAGEMEQVGARYNKLTRFIKANSPATEEKGEKTDA